MEMPGSPAALHVPHIAVEKLAVRESLTLSTDMPHSTLRRAPGSFVGIPVTLEQSSSRFLSFLDLDAIAVAVESDANSLIKFIPDIATFLEHSCLEKADNCKLIWSTLGPLLSDLQNVPARPPLAVLQVPKCTEIPVECVSIQGEKYVDEFLWLKKKEDQGVLDYIQSENAYTTRITEPTKPLQNLLYREFVSRLDQNRISVHLPAEDGWSYFYRDIPGLEYSAHCRVDSHGTEQVYLDENILAYCPEFKGDNYFHLGFIRLATSSQLVAYGIDRTGQESHTTFFLDLNTGLLLPDRIENMADDLEFSNGEECVYYTVLDSVGRAYKLNRHILGQNSDTDIVLYHEEDEMFYLSISKSSDSRYLLIKSNAQITSETWYIDAHDSNAVPILLIPREEHVNYSVDHHNNYFYFLTNKNGKNNWILRSKSCGAREVRKDCSQNQEVVIPHRDFVLVEDLQFYENHMIVVERSNCLPNIRVVDLKAGNFTQYHYIRFQENVYSLHLGPLISHVKYLTGHRYHSSHCQFIYTSFTQPQQVIDYDLDTRQKTVIHLERLADNYDKSHYESKRIFATGHDGTAVPVSLVYRRDLLGIKMIPRQLNPTLLHAYGAYGECVNPIFSLARISLLDRGFIFAVAHTRGGSEMGNRWYDEGRLSNKMNTFQDFCSVAEHLISEGYTQPSKLAIYGRSAGGLLIAAVINFAPQLFQAALTEVPFVDVITTMSDSSIPWTAFEYEEWGNPAGGDIYDAMKAYDPYRNMDTKKLGNNEYPHLLVLSGMNDPRVAYFEPLRWIAKMRKLKADSQKGSVRPQENEERLIMLQIDDAGHAGSSGVFSHFETLAFEYAFLITKLGAPMKQFHIVGATEAKYSVFETLSTTTEPELKSKAKSIRAISPVKSGSRLLNHSKGRLKQWLNNLF